MGDFILVEGDQAIFLTFGAAIVAPTLEGLRGSGPATLSANVVASGPASASGKKLCVAGDEGKVALDCVYLTPQYSIPGTGTLKIAALATNQKATKTRTGGKAVLLKGGMFTAKLEVRAPAKQIDPATGTPIPDPMTQYSGRGPFVTSNRKLRGT